MWDSPLRPIWARRPEGHVEDREHKMAEPRPISRGHFVASLCACVGFLIAASDVRGRADEKGENQPLLKMDDRTRAAAGAGSIVSGAQPLTAAALLQAGMG